jgi:hypothetical protein
VLGDQRGREGDGHNPHQQEEVTHEQRPVHLRYLGQQGVVVHPHDPDGQEADHVGEVVRPVVSEHPGAEPLSADRQQVEDEDRDGDGEHAVAERLGPP